MKTLIGYFKEVGVGREYGVLIAYLKDCVTDIADAKYVVYLLGNVAYVASIKNGNEKIIAIASNFSFITNEKI